MCLYRFDILCLQDFRNPVVAQIQRSRLVALHERQFDPFSILGNSNHEPRARRHRHRRPFGQQDVPLEHHDAVLYMSYKVHLPIIASFWRSIKVCRYKQRFTDPCLPRKRTSRSTST